MPEDLVRFGPDHNCDILLHSQDIGCRWPYIHVFAILEPHGRAEHGIVSRDPFSVTYDSSSAIEARKIADSITASLIK